jgi:hypothetical protein
VGRHSGGDTASASRGAWREATLGGRLAALDADRLVGRRHELALVERVLDRESHSSVVFVHGPVGIGKSALLRAAARSALERGYSVHVVDGRATVPVPDALAEALAPAFESDQPLVLIDAYEHLAELGEVLRRDLLAALSEQAVVLIGSRTPPESGWSQGGWESIFTDLRLRGLGRTEAYALLALLGHFDEQEMRRVAADARGSPLVLSLAGRTAGPGRTPAEVKSAVLRHLAEADLEGGPPDVLSIAAVARNTTLQLLEHVLGDQKAAREGYRWLAARTFVEKLGSGLRLHDVVQAALAADLVARAPEADRDLRGRIASYYAGVAQEGRAFVAIELAHLVVDPAVRWALSWQGAAEYHVDTFEPSDLEVIGRAMSRWRAGDLWESTERLVGDAPELMVVIRDAAGRPCGYVVSATPGGLPRSAETDALLSETARHVLDAAPDGDAVIVHDTQDLLAGPAGDRHSHVQGIATMAAVLRSGLDNPRRLLLRVDARTEPLWRRATAALGGRRIHELDRRVGHVQTIVFGADLGPAGLIGALHALAHGELGSSSRALARIEQETKVDAEAVREALRTFQVPDALAASPLAEGTIVAERVQSVREKLEDAIARAFGPSAREEALRELVVATYLTPGASREQVAESLYLSRSVYFRRLRAATERVVDAVLASAGPAGR